LPAWKNAKSLGCQHQLKEKITIWIPSILPVFKRPQNKQA